MPPGSPERAFGLSFASSIDLPGITACPEGVADVRVSGSDPGELRSAWPGGTQISREPLAVHTDPAAGHLLTAPGLGAAWVEPWALKVRAGPEPGVEQFHWERYLLGQVLPYIAGVRGAELLHASGVAFGQNAVALCGPSGVGKSTLTSHLLERGAVFVSDDALALTREPTRVVAHPGPAVRVVEGAIVPARVVDEPLRLGAVVLMRRGAAALHDVGPEPARLLGTIYDVIRRAPDRLLRVLDLLAAAAEQALVLELTVPDGGSADAADRLTERLTSAA